MVSKAKLYSQLDLMEEELRERLISQLKDASHGNNDLVFSTGEFNTFPKLKYRADPETENLIALGRQILALRDKLGESSVGTVAERICWYCQQWGDSQDQRRPAARALAKQFLEEILNGET